jgi:hypothetical protein
VSLSTNTFVETNKDRLLSELKDFLRIPSVSTLPEHVPDIQRAAEFVASSLRAAKMEHVEVIRWYTQTGCMRPENRRSCATVTTMCSRRIRWMNG